MGCFIFKIISSSKAIKSLRRKWLQRVKEWEKKNIIKEKEHEITRIKDSQDDDYLSQLTGKKSR